MSSPRFLVYCPVGVKTGGPECLYQLCDALNVLGYTSVIVPTTETLKSKPCEDFGKYQVNYLVDRDVTPDDVLIIPEVINRIPNWLARKISPSNLAIWWLSVDNSPITYFNSYESKNNEVHSTWAVKKVLQGEAISYRFKSIPWKTLHFMRNAVSNMRRKFETSEVKLESSNHFAQSEYARSVVSQFIGMKVEKLSDYVYGAEKRELPKFTRNMPQKVIAVNPFKGEELMRKFMSLFEDEVSFLELKGMTSKQISKALSKSDLYLDLGHFPGKDRIPREAILEGCPVFLAQRGAARNDKDFALPSLFKADLRTTTPIRLREIILGLLGDTKHFESQSDFFIEQTNAKQVFLTEVKSFADSFLKKS